MASGGLSGHSLERLVQEARELGVADAQLERLLQAHGVGQRAEGAIAGPSYPQQGVYQQFAGPAGHHRQLTGNAMGAQGGNPVPSYPSHNGAGPGAVAPDVFATLYGQVRELRPAPMRCQRDRSMRWPVITVCSAPS